MTNRVFLYDSELPAPNRSTSKQRRPANGLSQMETEFCLRWTAYYDPIRAAREAGYNPARAHLVARALLKNPKVKQHIAFIEKERLCRLRFDGDEFLAREIILATAPITELIETWIPPCRYCWGINNEYQRTHAEFQEDFEMWMRLPAERKRSREPTADLSFGTVFVYNDDGKIPFNQKGGDGYDPAQPPNPACPNCHGRGLEDPEHGTLPYIKLKDSRELSDVGKILYAGIEQGPRGIRQLINNQDAARARLMTMLGKFLELRGPDQSTITRSDDSALSFRMGLVGAARLLTNDPRSMSDDELDAALAQYGITTVDEVPSELLIEVPSELPDSQ